MKRYYSTADLRMTDIGARATYSTFGLFWINRDPVLHQSPSAKEQARSPWKRTHRESSRSRSGLSILADYTAQLPELCPLPM